MHNISEDVKPTKHFVQLLQCKILQCKDLAHQQQNLVIIERNDKTMAAERLQRFSTDFNKALLLHSWNSGGRKVP